MIGHGKGFNLKRSRSKDRPEVKLQPLYTTDEGGSVSINTDTWPNVGGLLGLTKSQIEEARRTGAKPPGGGGFVYLKGGPDNALELVEVG